MTVSESDESVIDDPGASVELKCESTKNDSIHKTKAHKAKNDIKSGDMENDCGID